MTEFKGDVHTAHCCRWHGCKYGDNDCTVFNQSFKQEYPCEMCGFQWEEYTTARWFDPIWIAYIEQWKKNGGHI